MNGRSSRTRRWARVRSAASVVVMVLLATPIAAFGVPPAFGPEAYLKASDAAADDRFGSAVAADGDTLVVGADGRNFSAGAAYVFVRGGAGWSQQARLEAASPVAGDAFGASVAISGDTIVVGAPGRGGADEGTAVVFVRSGTTWTQQAELAATNKGRGDSFGATVAIEDDTIVVGAPSEDSAGAGAPADDSATDSGAAYVLVRSGTTWTQQAYLKASAPDAGDGFGYSVDVHGDTVAVGVPSEGSGAELSGAVFVFTRADTTWSQQASLKASDAAEGDGFGGGVALHEDTLVVGAPNKELDTTSPFPYAVGAAYVWVRSGAAWSEEARLRASDATADEADLFGRSVAVDGDTVLVGAMYAGVKVGGFGPGAAYAFTRTAGTWSEVARNENGVGDRQDLLGFAVAVSGDTLAVGAPSEDSDATGVDGDAEDDSASSAGAVFVFVRTDLPSERTTMSSGPTLVVDPAIGVPGSAIRGLVSGAGPGVAFLWRLTDASGTVLAEGDVTADGSGAGEFPVPVPRTATGALTLELVDWGVRAELVVGRPVPTAIPAGSGPIALPPALSTLLVTSVLAIGILRGRRRTTRGSVGDTPA